MAVLARLGTKRPARLAVALAAFVAGLVATAVGIGVGVPHLAKVGWYLATVAGLASLLAGLALLGFAGAVLVRMTPGWWRLLAIPALLLPRTRAICPLRTVGAARSSSTSTR